MRTTAAKKSAIAIPIGTEIRFLASGLGASLRDDLSHMTRERYGVGEGGVVAFAHPNVKACPDWVYVEVLSKAAPGEKRYVGVSVSMVVRWPVSLPSGAWRLLLEIEAMDEDEEASPLADGVLVADVLEGRGLCAKLPGCEKTFTLTPLGREAIAIHRKGGAA